MKQVSQECAHSPTFSVIIATKNASCTLARCVDSVLSQTFESFELIIQDGESTDGTLECLATYDDPRLTIHSEPDESIYQAWNRALEQATGEWICFLGADDYYWSTDVLSRLHPHCRRARQSGIRFVYGSIHAVNGVPPVVLSTLGKPWESARQRFVHEMSVPHPGSLHHRDLFHDHGQFDPSFKIVGDYDFLLRELPRRAAWFADGIIIAGVSTGG
ncbi:MAG: glycosyltransferase, partial [Magnetococcales bacterium]|nr:glycosyltransferase [Magnetococcales bacterium]